MQKIASFLELQLIISSLVAVLVCSSWPTMLSSSPIAKIGRNAFVGTLRVSSVTNVKSSNRLSLTASADRGSLRCYAKTVDSNLLEKREFLFIPDILKYDEAIYELSMLRPRLQISVQNTSSGTAPSHLRELRWAAYHHQVNVDSFTLEPMYLSGKKLSALETAVMWNKHISQRINAIAPPNKIKGEINFTPPDHSNYMDAGIYQKELDTAVGIVQRVAYASRSVQQMFVSVSNTSNPQSKQDMNSNRMAKVDMTPVTIVDYGAQAIILSELHRYFPNDTFIAEEDSSHLKLHPELTEKVLDFVHLTLGGKRWSRDQLFGAIDLGSSDEHKLLRRRAWVLDPIDGTKGFIRGEHYCVALALLDYEKPIEEAVNKRRPVLSVLGCPQLSLSRVLDAPSVKNKSSLSEVFPPHICSENGEGLQVFDSHVGSIFFATKDMGAYVKSLDMPCGQGFPCQVSDVKRSKDISLCESREALMATSRIITGKVCDHLKMSHDFVRLDGQCKHGLVGAGSVEGSLRLPPPGYIEKIWDQAPGLFFIEESGGKVTDLKGREVDFSAGSEVNDPRKAKELDARVKGVIVSNGKVHSILLEAVQLARDSLKDLQHQKDKVRNEHF